MDEISPIAANETPQRLTYRECLSVTWLLTWRGSVLGGVVGFGIGMALGLLGAMIGVGSTTMQPVVVVATSLTGFFIVGPLIIVPMMFRKQYATFHFRISR